MNKPPDPGGFVSPSRLFCLYRLLPPFGFKPSWPISVIFPHRRLVAQLILYLPAAISGLLHQRVNCSSQASFPAQDLSALFAERLDNSMRLPMFFLPTMLIFVRVSLALATTGISFLGLPWIFVCPVTGVQYLVPVYHAYAA